MSDSDVDKYTRPRWESSALLLIDLQRDFLDDGPAPIPGTTEVLPPVGQLITAFRAARRPIAHVVRLYRPDGTNADSVRRRSIEEGASVVTPGSLGSEPADGLLPAGAQLDAELLLAQGAQSVGPMEMLFYKPRWSAFYCTRLADWLASEGCDTVVVAGCNLPNCPRATLFDATQRDLRSVLVTDAVSQTSPERLADLQRIGAHLMSVAQVCSHLVATS